MRSDQWSQNKNVSGLVGRRFALFQLYTLDICFFGVVFSLQKVST
jgi:hypothetical protein